MPQYVVQWTIYAQRVVEAESAEKAIEIALELGPDPDGSVTSDIEPPETKLIEDCETGNEEAMKRPEKRGVVIPLAESSWRLILEALVYVVEKPHLDDLEEEREKLGKILRYIERKLKEI